MTQLVEAGDLAALADFQSWGHIATMAHPTYDHYLPLLHAAGAVRAEEACQFFNADYQMGAISMRSMVWGMH